MKAFSNIRYFLFAAAFLLLSFLSAGAQTFSSEKVPSGVLERMKGRSLPENSEVSVEDLRYLQISYYDFNGEIRLGEMVCNAFIASDLLEIFRALYENRYQIRSIRLIDDFGADDNASMEADNSSCFNYRRVAGSKALSKHALGLAVDINPFENPFVKDGVVKPASASGYAVRTPEKEHMIDSDDLCCKLFKKHGFIWGGDWRSLKDYQHFEKALPKK